jgi:Flp pilus assembly protein TadG
MAVEFAFVAPVLILLVLGILGLGRAFYTYVDLTNAARAGARYLAAQSTCNDTSATLQANVKSAAETAQPNLKPLSTPTLKCAPLDTTATPPIVIPKARGVTLTYLFDTRVPHITSFPFVGPIDLFGVIPLSASATMPVLS